MSSRRLLVALAVAAVATAVAGPASGQSGDTPPPQELVAASSLPPGESGFFSVTGQAQGTATGDFGAHVDDQRESHWAVQHKPAPFHAEGTPEQPKDGVRIYRDSAGVPAIYGDTGRDVWWGSGYAAAQDRLFLMDAVRRTGEGTLAELTGAGAVPDDVRARVLTYSDAEYDAMEARLSPEARDAFEGYVDGANAWREKVIDDPRLLPAEYVLLSSLPEPFTVRGSLAGGVYITRYVASEGGNEMDNVAALRELQESLGRSVAHAVFTDLVWNDDPLAAVTIPASEGRFSNQPTPPGVRKEVFARLADWAVTLPPGLAHGPGTGAYPEPAVPPASAPTSTPNDGRSTAVRVAAAKAAAALDEWR
ncbi:MAG TPA: penicillin acylase family protein, partial [Mycobacteriales bacterium]|nr:penicillin acylase family protein [Mycobacteriales bacterium]